MSAMRNSTTNRNVFTAVTLILMFLLADVFVPSAFPAPELLEEEPTVQHVISTISPSLDTYIDSDYPNDDYAGEDTGLLGISGTSDARLLLSFPLNFASTDTIHSARLDLVCSNAGATNGLAVYPASTSVSWDQNATWNSRDGTLMWAEPGAEDGTDRSDWEPPIVTSPLGPSGGSSNVQLNVTALAQSAVSSSASTLEILVSALNSQYDCAMNETLNIPDRPSLRIDSSTSTAGSGGAITPNFVDDGAPLMSGDFYLSADLTPSMTWDSYSGILAEVQLSLNDGFKSDEDNYNWLYNTNAHASSFTVSGTTGALDIPSSDAFDNGTTMHYRMRAMDSTGTLGSWTSGSFFLPTHDVTANDDGSASIAVDINDLADDVDFIEDTYVDEDNKNDNYGSVSTVVTQVTSTRETISHFRINFDRLGLHSNATIIEASLNLTRSTSSGSATLALHEMDTADVWSEGDVTWRRPTTNQLWDEGGREYLSYATDSNVMGSQTSDDFAFDVTSMLQQHLDNSGPDSLDFAMTARSQNGAYAANNGVDSVTFHSSDAFNEADKPHLYIKYDWSNPVTVAPSLTSPWDGETLWNQTGHNFSGNTTPTLTWTSSTSSSYDMIFELSTDSLFHDQVTRIDTRTDTDFAPSDGELSFTGLDSLEAGHMYNWRMLHVDSDNRHGEWSYSSFLISAMNSTWLGGDRYEFRLKQGNASSDGLHPACADTYIDSGMPNSNYGSETELQVSYNTIPSETTVLFGCDLSSTFLPSGYAVESANLELYLSDFPFGSPVVGAWENTQHGWTEDGATWATYDGTNTWNSVGAKGSERSSLLDSVSIGSGFTSSSSVNWNVTLAVQNAMRNNHSADFILGIVGAGSGQIRDVLFHTGTAVDAKRPELSFVYVPGSNAIPLEPTPVLPLNGSWSVADGINPEPIDRPLMNWTHSTGVSVSGYAVQLDTVNTFDSNDMSIETSWSNSGFDLTNNSFTPTSDLDDGKTWYWRVRAISSTNQLGNWSETFHFNLPSLVTWNLSSTSAAVEIRHHEAMPALQLPHFIDTWVAEGGIEGQQNHSTSTTLKVGELGSGYHASALLKIPLNQLPTPSNARVTNAELTMWAQSGSDSNVQVAVRPVLQTWTTGLNNSTYDGTNNWSADGGRGIGTDVGSLSDLSASASADWMDWDVTEIVQAALANGDSYLSIALMTSDSSDALITFTSTEGLSTERPWLNLTWTDGTATIPTIAASNSLPVNDDITWDLSTHVPEPSTRPVMTWTHSNAANIDDWKVFIQNDATDIMQGFTIYDSRVDTALFDLQSLSFQPSSDLATNQSIRWFVQPVNDEMLGPRSTSSVFHIPHDIGNEINSTWGYINVSEGGFLPDLNEPSGFVVDTTLDSAAPNANLYNSGTISVGRSGYSSGTSQRSSFIVSVDLTKLPINGTYEIMDAFFTLNTKSTSYGEVYWTVSLINTAFDGNANWNNATSSTQWNTPGAYHSTDTDIPFLGAELIDASDMMHLGDITGLLQQAVANGLTSLDFLVQAEENESSVDGRLDFYSSNEVSAALRPSLNITYRMTNAYVDASPTGLLPVDATTVWNYSSVRPAGADHVNISWSPPSTNFTGFFLCSASDARMIYDLSCIDTGNSTELSEAENLTWDAQNSTLTVSNLSSGDEWLHWRLLSYQWIVDGHIRFGEWSQVNTFRVPSEQGYDDGLGNHTVNLASGSIFSDTGLLPAAPDTYTVSSTLNTNYGGSTTLKLGASSSGDHEIFIEFDLSQMPWPSAMTPTSTMLRLYRTQVAGVSPLTVSAHACSTFTESSVTALQPPACSGTEITRSTLSVTPPSGWLEWDITSLAQSNIANGNMTMTVQLKAVGTGTSLHTFASGEHATESWRPTLRIDYVDNVAGVVPPAQPVLLSPLDGAVLYDTTNNLLESLDKPVLNWNTVSGATGYIVTIRNASGQYTFKSATSSQITGTSFTFADTVAPGSTFEWWVQAVNGSIPGPSSSRWIVGIGDPLTSDNNDHTWTYQFQTGNEIEELAHTNVQDVSLFSGLSDTNLDGNANVIGVDAGQDEYRLLLSADFGQIPFNPSMNVHSVSLSMYLEDLNFGSGATGMTFTVHRMITSGWSETTATWNGTGSTTWAVPGMQSGVDYDATPIDTVFISNGQAIDTTILFNLGHRMMYIDGVHEWVIIGTPTQGWMEADFADNSDATSSKRPLLLMNYTDIDSITISPTATTTDADSTVQFSASTFDYNSLVASVQVEWSSSSGTIDSTGLFTPSAVGSHTITACFGVICQDEAVTVTPGAPVDLVVTPLTATITADETLALTANVVDQHGNAVPGESITFTPSNGTMGGTFGDVFQPYTVGGQTVTVTWGTTSIVVNILVELGAPTDIELTGCAGVVPAGTECEITTTLYDQFGNVIPLSEAGALSYSVNDGFYSEATSMYFANTVGTWQLSLTSAIGLSDSITIQTGHGQMASLEITPSVWDITADEVVFLNTTRIDIQGNRLPVVLPLANWTSIDDGALNITVDHPVQWIPSGLGGRVITAQYETTFASITINVTKGVMVDMVLIVDSADADDLTFAITADDTLVVKAKASDGKGNRWTIDVNWTVAHPDWNDQSVLLYTLSDETEFMPILSSSTAYVVRAEYTFNGQLFSEVVNVEVSEGIIQVFTMNTIASNGDTGTVYNISADHSIDFSVSLSDGDLNPLDVDVLTWLFEDIDSGETTDMTTEFVAGGYQWDATTVGNYRILAFVENADGFNYTRSVDISVYHGVAVSLDHELNTFDEDAGESIDITITGTDSDGNTFAQDVEWMEDGSTSDRVIPGSTTGSYLYQASAAGDHVMEYSTPGASNTFELKISPQMIVDFIEVELSAITVEQQASLTVTVQAFDRFANPIPVPSSARVDATGRGTVESTGLGTWKVTTLDSGAQTITVSAGQVSENFEIEVTGTFGGFFAAGGPLYYVGAVLVGLIAAVVLGLLVMAMRSGRGDDDWDDDYDDEDDEDEPRARGPSGPAPGPSGPAPGPSGPAPGTGPSDPPPQEEEEKEDTSWMVDHRTDDDGTEWAQSEDETWYYREPGQTDWVEWQD
ncbi:MAG: DNRLRE domain-containing protein [Candidatus Poseidoniaceae archaeon]